MTVTFGQFIVVVPAAGVGKRMKSTCPKQYLLIDNKSILTHTVERLLSHQAIAHVIIALGPMDEYFPDTGLANHPNVTTVVGGQERVNSVLAGLSIIDQEKFPWVLVHDAARPCLVQDDLNALMDYCLAQNHGAILATPVRDTMKQANVRQQIESTVDRSMLWHALTPQMFKVAELVDAITSALAQDLTITDEASAMELAQLPCGIVNGRSDNIKITQPEDLSLAQFILTQQKNITSQDSKCE